MVALRGSSADKPAVAFLIGPHALLELPAFVAAVHSGSVDVEVLADTGASTVAYVVHDRIFVLIAGTFSAQAAADAAENIKLIQEKTELLASKKLPSQMRGLAERDCTYTDADCEDDDEVLCFIALVCVEIVNEKNLSCDVRVAHGLEQGHSDPEPDVESCESSAEISAELEALFPSCYSHCKNEFLLIIALIITNGNKQQIYLSNRSYQLED